MVWMPTELEMARVQLREDIYNWMEDHWQYVDPKMAERMPGEIAKAKREMAQSLLGQLAEILHKDEQRLDIYPQPKIDDFLRRVGYLK